MKLRNKTIKTTKLNDSIAKTTIDIAGIKKGARGKSKGDA